MRLSSRIARLSTALTAFLAAITGIDGVAWAITGGIACSDPNGLRRHVVRIVASDGMVCSGTIVGPRKIVTAAHCFPTTDAGRYRIMVLDHNFAEHWVAVSSIRVHPKFDRQGLDRQTQLNDIAVVNAAASLPGDMAIAPIGGRAAQGEVTAVGFGTGYRGHDLRQVELQARSAALSPTGSQILTSIDGGACSGDSGGPVFRKSGKGFVLVGVISWTQGSCGSMTAVTPVGPYRGFIGG